MEKQGHHILLVDDSADDRHLYSYYLRCKGFRVTEAVDGVEGVERTLQLRPDAVLLDFRLPKMDGREAASLLKKDERTRDIPVVIITGHSDISADNIACEGLLLKPCSPGDLLVEILRVLRAGGKKDASNVPGKLGDQTAGAGGR